MEFIIIPQRGAELSAKLKVHRDADNKFAVLRRLIPVMRSTNQRRAGPEIPAKGQLQLRRDGG